MGKSRTEGWRWIVSDADQAEFAEISGDYNPLHVDDDAARRLPFGRRAVHGVHLLCRALDQTLRNRAQPLSIQATFRRSVGIGDRLRTRLDGQTGQIIIDVDDWRALDATIETTVETTAPPVLDDAGLPEAVPPAEEAADLAIDAIANMHGSLAVMLPPSAHQRFPHLYASVGARGMAELLAMTRLVGMVMPGRRSLFSSLDLNAVETAAAPAGLLRWSVRRFDERFGRVLIDVEGDAWRGRLTAFVRPDPVDVMADTSRVSPLAFGDQRWLIVGGSRGLGSAVAQLVAAGNAEVRLTYRRGSDKAQHIAAIVDGSAWPLDTDTVESCLTAITADGWRPTHLAWFASPPIFVGTAGVYSNDLYRRFESAYVVACLHAIRYLGPELRAVLWPSSTALDSDVAGLAEYTAAKRSGEIQIAEFATTQGLTIAIPRLPRLLTDQSTSVVPVEFADTTTELLRALEPFSRNPSTLA